MYNFFVNTNQISDNKITINGKDAKHISTVLRMKTGDKIYVSVIETTEKYLTEIRVFNKENVECSIIEKVESTELDVNITLYQGLPKSDKMELIIQKSVELGVYDITPIDMKNCVAKLKDEDKKNARWQLISESAAKQSKRNIIPKVNRMINIKKLSEEMKQYDLVLIAYEDESKTTVKQILKENKVKNIAIVIGPEGGITSEECMELKKKGAKLVSLGKRILRTETAALAMISMISYEYEL